MRHIFVWSAEVETLLGPDLAVRIAEVATSDLDSGKTKWQVEAPMFTLALDVADELFDKRQEMILVHVCSPAGMFENHQAFTVNCSPDDRCSVINTALWSWARGVELQRQAVAVFA